MARLLSPRGAERTHGGRRIKPSLTMYVYPEVTGELAFLVLAWEKGASVLPVRRPRASILRLALVAAAAMALRGAPRNRGGRGLERAALGAGQQAPRRRRRGQPERRAPLPDLPKPRLSDTSLPRAKPVKKPRPRLKAGALPPLRPYPGAERLGLRGGATDPTVDAAGAADHL